MSMLAGIDMAGAGIIKPGSKEYNDAIGQIQFGLSRPGKGFVPADGLYLKKGQYPALAKKLGGKYNQLSGFGTQISVPGTPAPGGGFRQHSWSPNGRYLAIHGTETYNGHIVLLYEMVEGVLTKRTEAITGGSVTGSMTTEKILWTSNSRYYIFANSTNVYVYEVTETTHTQVLAFAHGAGTVSFSTISPDDRVLVIGGSTASKYLNCYQFDMFAMTLTALPALTNVGSANIPSAASPSDCFWQEFDSGGLRLWLLYGSSGVFICRFDNLAVPTYIAYQNAGYGSTSSLIQPVTKGVSWHKERKALIGVGGTPFLYGFDLDGSTITAWPAATNFSNALQKTAFSLSGEQILTADLISGATNITVTPANPVIKQVNRGNGDIFQAYSSSATSVDMSLHPGGRYATLTVGGSGAGFTTGLKIFDMWTKFDAASEFRVPYIKDGWIRADI